MSAALSKSTSSAGRSAHQIFSRAMIQAAIGAITVFSIADENPAYFVLSLLGVLMVWIFSVRPKQPAPRLLINSILMLVVVYAGIEMLRIGVGVNAFAIFAVLLLIVKMLDLREPRDDGQIIVLTVSILIAAVLTSNTLMTGVLTVIVSILIMRAVVYFQIHAVLSMSAKDSSVIVKGAKIDIRSMLFATGFLCAIIGSVIFVVLPRNIGVQAFGQWGELGQSVSGFSDSVELGRPGRISQSSTPVLDLTVTDRNGANVGSESSSAIYLRGAVLNEYDNGKWVRSSMMSNPFADRIRRYPPNSTLNPQGNESLVWDRQYDFTIRSSANGPEYLFTPWKTTEFRVGDDPMRLGLDFKRGIFLKDGFGGRIEYSARARNTEFEEVAYDKFTDRNDVIPAQIEPEIAQLARQILTDGGVNPDPLVRPMREDIAAVRLIENHLRSRYSYTLDSQPVPNGEDATKWFLFERKTGHCEYYASALTLMSRSIGIPARVITGYVVSDFNTVTGQYVVRQSNAHAWIEAEIAPGHWRAFDGTPPADFHQIHEPDPSMWRSIAKFYESVEFLWVRSVVAYDSDAQQSIMGAQSTDLGLSNLGENLLNRLAAGRGRLIGRSAIVAGIVFASSMLIGIMLIKYKQIIANSWLWVQHWINRIQNRLLNSDSPAAHPRFDKLDRSVRRSLQRLEIPKPDWKPLKLHLAQELATHDLITDSTREALIEASDVLYRFEFSAQPQLIDLDQVSRLVGTLRRSEKLSKASR